MTNSPLFICDLANNHFGDVAHAKQIISELAKVSQDTKARIAVKFQFRDYDSYIHPRFQDRRDLKYIERFLSTRLDLRHFDELHHEVKAHGLISMATPFDEKGVDWCNDLDIDYVKIASVSANDSPLLEKVFSGHKPVVASTGGLRMDEIDRLVFSALESRIPSFTLMHCVSIYPCPDRMLGLNQITNFLQRYEGLKVGFSTHEDPSSLIPVVMATALCASVFERHVGISTERYPLNGYSSSPKQVEEWINAQKEAVEILGPIDRVPARVEETETLRKLKRGVYALREIQTGESVSEKDVYSAFPLETESQYWVGEQKYPLISTSPIMPNEPITRDNTEVPDHHTFDLADVILQAKSLLSKAKVKFNEDAQIEISHHYGLGRFREMGAILITCYNDEYAKKLVIQLPRQKHPYHFHKEKKESFQLLWGDMEMVIDGRVFQMKPGQIVTVNRGQWHKFSTLHGAVVEEISTRAISSDSYYEDPAIAKLNRSLRKTIVESW